MRQVGIYYYHVNRKEQKPVRKLAKEYGVRVSTQSGTKEGRRTKLDP